MPALAVVSSMMDAIMNELRIPVNNLIERTKIQAQMSYVYGDICAKQDWWWLLKKHAEFAFGKMENQTFAELNPTLTASLSFTSRTVTLSSAPTGTSVTYALNGAAIYFTDATPGARGLYRVTTTYAPAGGTTLSLEGAYTGPTATGVAFKAYRDYIVIPDTVAKVLRVTCGGTNPDLKKISIEEMSQLRQQGPQTGRPQAWSVYDFSTSGDASTFRRIWIYPYPDQNYPVEVWYKHQTAGDLSDIAIPTDYQQVLNYGTLSRCYPIFLNDIERGQYYLALFNDIMGIMSNQQREYATDHPGINPSADLYRPRTSRRRAGSLGNLFDIYPSVP